MHKGFKTKTAFLWSQLPKFPLVEQYHCNDLKPCTKCTYNKDKMDHYGN